jgi:hypothetical protein
METLLSVLGFTKDIVAWIIKFVQPKIEVKPKEINISKTDWNKEGYFTVCNKTDAPLFDTQVLLWLTANSVIPPSLQVIKIDDQGNDNELKIENISINSGAFIVKGITNEKGVMLIQLRYLAPKACKRVFFSLEQQLSGKISLQAVSTSTKPSETLSSTNKIAIPFTPPRNITVTNISLFMKKQG